MSKRMWIRQRLKAITRWIVVPFVAALGVGLAFANGNGTPIPGFEWDPAKWASDVSILGGTIALLTGFVRATFWKTLDGIMVNAFTIILGVGFGILLFALNHFDTFIGGISHGIQAAIASWVMVDGGRRALATATPTNTALQALAGGDNGVNTTQKFILDLVRNALPGNMLTAGLAAIAPLLREFAQSEEVLTDDRRFSIQRRVLQALRAAGMEGVNLGSGRDRR